jgi:putative FmdB family regulatory protein
MPTYEYRCTKGHTFDAFQKMSDEPLDTCPECGADAERMLSAGAGLLFKGSGFYITDTRSDSYKKDAAGDTSKSGGSDGGETSSSSEGSSSSKDSSSTSSD